MVAEQVSAAEQKQVVVGERVAADQEKRMVT